MNQSDTKNKNFCIMPHTHMEIAPRGGSRPCCAYRQDLIFDNKDDMFSVPQANVAKTSMDNIFNNHFVWKQARRLSSNNEFNPACVQCHMEEKAGLESYRIGNNNKFGKYIDELEDDKKLLSLELKLGAKCNLACRICTSFHSNKLLKEDSIKIWGNINKDWMRSMQAQSDWSQDEKFWKQIYDVSENLKYIKFTGGEPLIIDQHFEYLEWLAEQNLDVEISYITNGTVKLSDKIKNIWSKFSHVHMSISIDAVGELEEYIRTGCNWEEQKTNIQDYVEFLGADNIGITCTVGTLNVHKINEFIEYFEQAGLSNKINFVFNVLTSPAYLSIRNLNDDAKHHLNSVYNNLINTNRNIPDKIINGLNNIRNSFNREKDLNFDSSVAVEITKKDAMHNLANKNKERHSFKELEPEWFEILKEKGETC